MKVLHSPLTDASDMSTDSTEMETADALIHCAQVCYICAEACLTDGSSAVLQSCILLSLDCAAICNATGKLFLHQDEVSIRNIRTAHLHACVRACRACGDACLVHAGENRNCAICAETCIACYQKCTRALETISFATLPE